MSRNRITKIDASRDGPKKNVAPADGQSLAGQSLAGQSSGGQSTPTHAASARPSSERDAENKASDGHPPIASISEVLDDIRAGRMVIIVDDEDRENEGDLIMAADCVTPEAINFMARHGRGLICLTLDAERCERLGLELMTRDNNARYSTNFTVSIEAAEGVTTGISAADRAATVLAAVASEASAADIVSPGHIFPIMAKPGGVLTRAGHTEAGVDLARITGHFPSSVICEVLNEDGTMARLGDLQTFGREHGIKVGTIADLIRYRLENEPTIMRVEQHLIETRYGPMRAFAYQDVIDADVHLALVCGEIETDQALPVRVHAHMGIYDAVSQAREDTTWSVSNALKFIGEQGQGVLVLLHYDLNGPNLLDRLRQISQSHHGAAAVQTDEDNLRMLGVGSQILADLGVGRMRVLGSSRKMSGLQGFGLEVTEYITPTADAVAGVNHGEH